MTTLTIEHTHETGTLVEGTARGDGTAPILKRHGFRWSRNLGQWYLPRSRDQHANDAALNRTADELRADGHEVEVSIDNTARDVATVEVEKEQRAEVRAERRADLAAKAQDREKAARAASDRYTARFAEGQPILVGHHSEQTARNAQRKGWEAMGRAIAEHEKADYHQDRAHAASAYAARRNNPVTVANRIARLEADARRLTRRIDGHTRTVYTTTAGEKVTETTSPASGQYAEKLWTRRAEIAAEIAYWQGIRDAQIERGEATSYSRETIQTGDRVKIRGRWDTVVRANAKTVTTQSDVVAWTMRYPYAEIKDHQRPDTAQ